MSEPLPTGYVNFLMTDIEESSRFWDKEPEAMQKAVDAHDDLISKTIKWFGGVLLKSRGEGDSAVGIFRDPGDSVACSLELQRLLVKQYWPTSSPIRVRIALHSGGAELRADDYYGVTIVRCARLRSIAHGGQVLLSRSTSDAVRERLPEGVTLEDLGSHWLQGLSQSERVSQLCHPDLPKEFPPLRSEKRVLGSQPGGRKLVPLLLGAGVILVSVLLATSLTSIFRKSAPQAPDEREFKYGEGPLIQSITEPAAESKGSENASQGFGETVGSQLATLVLTLRDQNDNHPEGIPVRVSGLVETSSAVRSSGTLIMSDKEGRVRLEVPPGQYLIEVVAGCTDRLIVEGGGRGRSSIEPGSTVAGELLVKWRSRIVPAIGAYPSQYPDWYIGQIIEIDYDVRDRCRDSKAPGGSYPAWAFRTNDNLEIVGTPRLVADEKAQGLVNVRCTHAGEASLVAFDSKNLKDEFDFTRYMLAATGFKSQCTEKAS
jgi:class 3 adenylate cyclase